MSRLLTKSRFNSRSFIFGIALVSTGFAGLQAKAQEAAASTSSSFSLSSESRNQIIVDLVPSLVSLGGRGASLSYQRELGTRFSLGPFVSYQEQRPFLDLWDEVKFKYLFYGLQSRFKFNGFLESGFYLGASLFEAEVQGEGEVSSILSSGRAEARSEKFRKTGWQTAFGYIFQGRNFSSGQMFVDVGLTYGIDAGVTYETSASGELGGRTKTASLTIKDLPPVLGLTGAIGLTF